MLNKDILAGQERKLTDVQSPLLVHLIKGCRSDPGSAMRGNLPQTQPGCLNRNRELLTEVEYQALTWYAI